MKDHIPGVLLAIVGLALIALLVGKNAQTGSVIGAIGKGFSGPLACALSPITGGGNCGTQTSSSISFGNVL